MKQPASASSTRRAPALRLRAGDVYRRKDLAGYFSDVDRELGRLVEEGQLCKAARGLYYVPRATPFGAAPPTDEALVAKFLEDDRFLIINPSSYNVLGLGTTQICNTTLVYNHKRHGNFKLAGMDFDFREKAHFPTAGQVTREFLLVDMLNNLDQLAEDPEHVLSLLRAKLPTLDAVRLDKAVKAYGSAKTRRLLRARFFSLLASNAFRDDDFTYDEVFGETLADVFSAREAAEYLEVSLSTLRRYVQSGQLVPSEVVGRSQLFAAKALRAFKRGRVPGA